MPPAPRQRLCEHRFSELGGIIYVDHIPDSTGGVER
jgi:hypothetical protein